MESTIIIEDFSALGQISMVASLSILQTFGCATAALPTSLLSTQTEGFGQPVQLATSAWFKATISHWQDQNVKISTALIGYLGNQAIISDVIDTLTKFRPSLVLVDPAMADQGELYPGLDSDYVDAIRQLCHKADLITPNVTELALLTDCEVPKWIDLAWVQNCLNKLESMGILASVVVSGVRMADQIGSVIAANNQLEFIASPYFSGHFYGTGDTFAPLLLGFLRRGVSLKEAVQKSTKLMEIAVEETSHLTADDRKYGLRLAKLLGKLSTEVANGRQKDW
ncbi:PfkB family carbohydrate kinase [uncultured Limosilactobacillus sp.]|uniref:PfkB family carbohydrate kinase n=1 Tax=uncultured Limosilactobacillus sp. TaxID=2837629 RepID=UPI0025FA3368|nr:PfkB family carbohydrate kinase [uncultured Limosilactobacillus sp.]